MALPLEHTYIHLEKNGYWINIALPLEHTYILPENNGCCLDMAAPCRGSSH